MSKCNVDEFSSRVCERGTKGCVVEHLTEWTCVFCRKPIKGKVFFQGGSLSHPVHGKCRLGIKPSKKHGGGV